MLHDKTLLITGGTGSFGHSVLKHFLSSDIREIRIFSRDEEKQDQMRNMLGDERVKFYIGDIRSYQSLFDALRGVDYVFHAAALKQVPSCEFYPMEAVNTNIIGTENVLNAGIANSIKKIVVLSTDKAVYPISAMGLTKALAEKIMVAKSRSAAEAGTVLCATRYGNVMASRGSVIPLFTQQIKNNLPLTITDPKMTRFLMSLDDSVELVKYAFEHGEPGDIFVQKSSASTIYDLAQALLELFESQSQIKIIGTRHGEKLYESLISREEMAKAEDKGAYFRIKADNRDLNYKKYFIEGEEDVNKFQDYNSHNTTRLNVAEIKELLLKISYIHDELAKKNPISKIMDEFNQSKSSLFESKKENTVLEEK